MDIPIMTPPPETTAPSAAISLWRRFREKEISYLTLPLLVMATVVEIVILSTGFMYQKTVCVPQGMGVTLFGIGPLGAVILAVELLKLPLAIWTAARKGWLKAFMIAVGLPLICVLTFQLVKDMAVYEMGVAMVPATELRDKAATEELKIKRLNEELENQTKDGNSVQSFVDAKRAERDRKLAELTSRQEKAKSEIEESLKRNDATRTDAITLTDYQKKELAEVEIRQAKLIQQCEADSAQLTKAIAELRSRREIELYRAKDWNAEEARIENAYKSRLSYYTNRKNAYEKAKAEYDKATRLERAILPTPVDPGVPPEREVNKLLKPTLLTELESQISTKEAELVAVNNRRRDGVATIESDARRIREDFDRRSASKREETDRKREELLAARTALVKETAAESEKIDREFNTAVAKEQATLAGRRPLDTVRGELDEARKRAEGFYEKRVEAIKETQVHRIATTVEIVRGILFGEHPLPASATSKERGDALTNQIDMVRISVYPAFAFIVAFLPTLMVEVGFSTLFKQGRAKPPHRLGFFGRGLHRLYILAGRRKILRAERLAAEVAAEAAKREQSLALAKQEADAALVAQTAELRSAQETVTALNKRHAEDVRRKEESWKARFESMSEALNRAVLEKDELSDLQKSEVERQVRLRQGEWLDRIELLRKEIDAQRDAADAERTKLMHEHQEQLTVASEDAKSQVALIRRQASDAALAAVEKSAKLAHELKEAAHAREEAENRLKQQTESLTTRLEQAKEDAVRDLEKAARREAHRLESQQLDFAKTLRQREDDFAHKLKQQEQELNLAFEARLIEAKDKAEKEARRRETELERELETRAHELDTRREQQLRQLEEAAQTRLKQREQQLQAQTAVLIAENRTQTELELRRQETEFKARLEAQTREAEATLRERLQQQEMLFLSKMKQRELDLIARADANEAESQNRTAAELRAREAELERLSEARARALEERLAQEAKQKEESFNLKLRQREQQLLAQADARIAELQAQAEQEARRREIEAAQVKQQLLAQADTRHTELLAKLELEARRREQDALRTKQREMELSAQLAARDEDRKNAERKWEVELQTVRANTAELLANTEKDRDDARKAAAEEIRRRESDAARAKLRESEHAAQLAALSEERKIAERAMETEIQSLRANTEAQLARVEKERDEARKVAVEETRRREQDAARAKQRETEHAAQSAAQSEERKRAEHTWETEMQALRAGTEAQLARTEKERDEARKTAAESVRQVQSLEEKLTEFSALFTGWKGGQPK